MSARNKLITLIAGAALAAVVAVPAIGSTASEAAAGRILSLNVAPSKVKTGKKVNVTWELSRAARTKFVVARCENKRCTDRHKVGDAIRRKGSEGLNTFKLRLRVSPARYAIVASTKRNKRKDIVRVVR